MLRATPSMWKEYSKTKKRQNHLGTSSDHPIGERERERTSDGSIVAVVLKNLSKNDPSTENNKSPKWKGKLSLYNDGFNKIESNH